MKKFTERYVEELLEQAKLLYPNKDEIELKKIISDECNKKFKNQKIKLLKRALEGDIEFRLNGIDKIDKREENYSLMKIINMIDNYNPIITGYGTIFEQHSKSISIEYLMVQDFIDLRKEAKKKKFEHINDEDKTLLNMFDTLQITYKVLNNSYYGASIQANSFFYHPFIGPGITQTGVVIITTSLNLFEKFMSRNITFRRVNDITLYINNILKEDYNVYDYINKDFKVKKNDLLKWFLDNLKESNSIDKMIIDNILSKLNDEQLTKIYLKNNLYETIDNSDYLQEAFKSILGNEDFLDPNEPPEKYMSFLNVIWNILEKVVHYDYMDFYRYDNAQNGKRKTILTVDTDSNFLYLYPFFSYCKEKFGVEDKEIYRMTTTNIIMYILTSLITKCYEMLTKNFNIEDKEKRKIIAMKNEFYYSRIMLTNAKKNYGGSIAMQEGNILKTPKLDIKGLPIKKVSTNREIREDFTNILHDDILTSENIEPDKILTKYIDMEKVILESLNKGEIRFSLPGRVNEIESYKEPYQIQTVRGSILWNSLYPNKTITYPEKVNMIKLKDDESLENIIRKWNPQYTYVNPLEAVKEIIYSNGNISDEEKERVIDIITKEIYLEEKISKYGLCILCLPKTETKIPEWVLPFIDVDKMIESHMKSGYQLLKSLNFNILTNTNNEVFSNIITI